VVHPRQHRGGRCPRQRAVAGCMPPASVNRNFAAGAPEYSRRCGPASGPFRYALPRRPP
jgi:hypothetical protein